MRIRLRLLYLIALIALSSDTWMQVILNDDKWFFKVLKMGFIIVYLYALSKLLIKITNYYTAIPKNSNSIHLQPWGKYYIPVILSIYIGLYIIAINTPEDDFFYIMLAIIIGYSDDMYQVVYEQGGKRYFYFEKHNISKEIESYDKSDKSIDLFFADEEHLLINTSYKTRKNKQLISDFFD